MPGVQCVVAACNNQSSKTNDSENVSFHKFPEDVFLKNIWLTRCGVSKWNSSMRICSAHFSEDDFERNMKAELLGVKYRKVLNSTAVPCKNLGQDVDDVNFKEVIQKKLANRKIVEELLSQSSKSDKLIDEEAAKKQKEENRKLVEELLAKASTSSEAAKGNAKKDKPLGQVSKKEESIRVKYESQLLKMNKLISQYKRLVRAQRTKIKVLQNHLTYVQKSSAASAKFKAIKKIKKVLTDNQLCSIVDKKKNVNWSDEELAKALTLRFLSRTSYIFVVQELNVPLPGVHNLKRWAARFRYSDGLLHNMFKVMKGFSESLTVYERSVVLQVDEIRIRQVYEYDRMEDQVVGAYTSVLVMMARALFDGWKELVYIGYDTLLNGDLILQVISALHEANYNVVALSLKWDVHNFTLWQDFGTTPDKSWFEHPKTGTKVYIFGDTNYCLMELRNWFLETGFTLPEGNMVDKSPIEILLNEAPNEDFGHKLTWEHIRLGDNPHIDLRTILDLMSHTTANALLNAIGPDQQKFYNTSTFIDLINAWYDLMTATYSNKSTLITKAPYGTHHEEQDAILQEAYHTINNMRCIKNEGLLIFQVAMLMSITSLSNLYKEVNTQFGVNFILPQKFNLACLDDFWRSLRTDLPPDELLTPVTISEGIKKLIVSKIKCGRGRGRPGDKEQFVTARMLKEAGVTVDLSDLEPLSERSYKMEVNERWNDSEEIQDWLKYISGYLALNLRVAKPELGGIEVRTYLASEEGPYPDWAGELPPWLHHIAVPVVLEPSNTCLRIIQELELCFTSHHQGDSLRANKGVVANLVSEIQSIHPQIPSALINTFVAFRTTTRINYLNYKLARATLEVPLHLDPHTPPQ